MNTIIREALHEQADRQHTPLFDADAIATAGSRRIRRTRTFLGALAVAAVTLAAVGVPPLLGTVAPSGGDQFAAQPGQQAAGAFADHRPTYAVGGVIHYGQDRLDVGERVASFVQTDDGFVYTTGDGRVHVTDGHDSQVVGRTSPQGLYLKSDDTGSQAAWIEFPEGGAPELVVYDTAEHREVLRTDEGTKAGMTSYRDTDAVYVYALDDGTVYWRNARGLVATDVASKGSTVLAQEASPFAIADVANGYFAHQVLGPDDGSTRLRVSKDLAHPTPPMPTGYDSGFLSPGARYVIADEQDQMAVYDVATRGDVTPKVAGYHFVSGYAWLDEHTFTAIGLARVRGVYPVDILSCTVPEGSCRVAAKDVATYDPASPTDLALPIGESID